MVAPSTNAQDEYSRGVIKDQMVAIARGTHLLPFRTEKLSPFTPMVLPQGGRVGSCLSFKLKACPYGQAFFILLHTLNFPSKKLQSLRNQKLKIELIWWFFTSIVLFIILLPIWNNVPAYPFFAENAFFIAAFITFTRYIFLLPITLIAREKWIKLFVIATAVILFFVMTTGLIDFNNFMDEKGLQTLVAHLHVEDQTKMINFIKNEMIFFGVGSIIAGILLPIRMLVSLWRMRNRGTV